MITVSQALEEILISSPFYGEAFQKDLVNFSGFARYYHHDIEERTMKKVTQGAIIMALKRLTVNNLSLIETPVLWKGTPDIIVRSNLFEFTVANDPEYIQKQKKLLEFASSTPHTLVTVTHGIFETTIIASMTIMDRIVKLYEDAKMIKTVTNISAITIKFPKDIIETPGVIYSILNIIAWNGVSLVEVVSTYSEFTLVLKQSDVDRAFSLLQKLFK